MFYQHLLHLKKCTLLFTPSPSCTVCTLVKMLIIVNDPLEYFCSTKGHAALHRKLGPGYNTLLLHLIQGDLYSACLFRQLKTLPGLLHSRDTLQNS